MKNQIAIACLGVAMVVGMEALADKAVPVDGDWRLEWADEFDGSEVNPAVWTFEEGWVRNNELQYYTVGRKENARIEDSGIRVSKTLPYMLYCICLTLERRSKRVLTLLDPRVDRSDE